MNTLASSETMSTLRDGAVLTANADLDFHLAARAPIAFDLHWLRSVAGILLGSTGIRVESEAAASISLAVSCHCLATVRRQDRAGQPWLRLTLENDRRLSAAPTLSVQATLPVPVPDQIDPLRLALTGEHPHQRFRAILKSLGSPACSAFLRHTGVPSRQLAVLAALWPSLTASTEPILWRATEDPAHLSAIRDATRWLATDCSSAASLQDARNPLIPLVLQWLEALTGSPVSSLLSDSAFRRAAQAASACLPLLQLPELPDLLRKVRRAPSAAPPEVSPDSNDFARRLYDSAGPALARTLSADLSLRLLVESSRTVLLDASFRMDVPGLELYRQALTGNLSPLIAASSPSAEIHDALLTESLLRRRTLEIHLPFLFSTSRENELAAISRAEIIPGADGRLTVVRSTARSTITRKNYLPATHNARQSRMIIAATLSAGDREPANDNFSLSFSDVRDILPGRDYGGYLQALAAYGIQNLTLPPGPARASLAITVPGSVVQAWARVPLSRTLALNPILCRVSLALQTTLRSWLPILYLANPDRYAMPSAVLPLLAYQFSQPYARVSRGHFTYDSMDPASILGALNSAVPRLAAALPAIQAAITAAGKPALTHHYDPERLPGLLQSVLRHRRLFAALLAADSFFIEQVFSLARYSRDLATTAAKDPRRTARDLHIFTTGFVRVFHRRLSRLYNGQDFTPLGSLLLVEATAALAGRRDAIQATFTIEPAPTA